jgi:hypothetical protein
VVNDLEEVEVEEERPWYFGLLFQVRYFDVTDGRYWTGWALMNWDTVQHYVEVYNKVTPWRHAWWVLPAL